MNKIELDDYIAYRKRITNFTFHDDSLWPFLDSHKGKRLKNVSIKELKKFVKEKDLKRKELWHEQANQYRITILGRLLAYAKRRIDKHKKDNHVYGITGLVWINDGEKHRRIKSNEDIPEGWVKGLSDSYKKRIRENTKKAMNTPEMKRKVSKATIEGYKKKNEKTH